MPRALQVVALVAASLVVYAFTAGGVIDLPEPLGTVAGVALAASWVVAFMYWHVDPYRTLVERRAAGRCVHCGYDLTGNLSGTCPECGAGRDS
jgi:hypothetical protein